MCKWVFWYRWWACDIRRTVIRVWPGNAFRSKADLRAQRRSLLETEYCSPVERNKERHSQPVLYWRSNINIKFNSICWHMAPEIIVTDEDSEYEAQSSRSKTYASTLDPRSVGFGTSKWKKFVSLPTDGVVSSLDWKCTKWRFLHYFL